MARTFCLNLVLFLSFAAPLSCFLSALDRYPTVIQDKLAYYKAHHDEFDTLVVGSSYTYFGLDPRELDARLAELGIESSTFNLAAFGLNGLEIDEIIRLALKEDTNRRLKRIIIDLRPLEAWAHVLFGDTKHAVWWHSPRQTWAALVTLWKDKRPVREKFRHSIRHIRLMAENHLPLGTAFHLKRERNRDLSTDWFWQSLSEYRGYEPLDAEKWYKAFVEGETHATRDMLMQRDRMMSQPELVETLRQELIKNSGKIGDLENENVEFWRTQTGELQAHDILVVHIAMPAYSNPMIATGLALAEQDALEHFLSFNDPEIYPRLFDVNNRFEFGHLNHEGAVIFSRLLAEHLAALLNGGTPPLNLAETETGKRRETRSWNDRGRASGHFETKCSEHAGAFLAACLTSSHND